MLIQFFLQDDEDHKNDEDEVSVREQQDKNQHHQNQDKNQQYENQQREEKQKDQDPQGKEAPGQAGEVLEAQASKIQVLEAAAASPGRPLFSRITALQFRATSKIKRARD